MGYLPLLLEGSLRPLARLFSLTLDKSSDPLVFLTSPPQPKLDKIYYRSHFCIYSKNCSDQVKLKKEKEKEFVSFVAPLIFSFVCVTLFLIFYRTERFARLASIQLSFKAITLINLATFIAAKRHLSRLHRSLSRFFHCAAEIRRQWKRSSWRIDWMEIQADSGRPSLGDAYFSRHGRVNHDDHSLRYDRGSVHDKFQSDWNSRGF